MTGSIRHNLINIRRASVGLALAFAVAGSLASRPALSQASIIPNEFTYSTVPSNGDVNPYGICVIPANYIAGGMLHPGDMLVSNFNNSANLQGTGSTIMRFGADGSTSVFFQSSGYVGLDAALAELRHGFVVVGSVPTADGTCATVQAGALIVLDRNGNFVMSISDPSLLNGPWNMTVYANQDTPTLFVSNVLSGAITRIDLQLTATTVTVTRKTQIASGYTHGCSPTTFVLGPAGLAYDLVHDTLYVASTADNAIYRVTTALKRANDGGMGHVVYNDTIHLHGPIGLLLAPNGDLLTANGDGVNADPNQPSQIVEFTTKGKFVSEFSANPAGLGGAFGITLIPTGKQVLLAAVDDLSNALHTFIMNP